MTSDIETLRLWLRIVVVIAAVTTTIVPVIYSTFPWRRSGLGRLFMWKAVSFALAMNMTALFAFWQPEDIRIVFWVDVIILTTIAASTTGIAIFMWWLSRRAKEK